MVVIAGAAPDSSIVIPVLNDAPALGSRLPALTGHRAVEVIVVDGAGTPGPAMARLAETYPSVIWMRAPRGRGAQMNAGAGRARGRWLLFLHADTSLGAGWKDVLDGLDGRREVVGGSFRFALDSRTRWARWIERGVALRVRLLDLPYGDQALFVRRTVFEEMGGYRELPLMEDVDFIRRLRRYGRLAHAGVPALTSARRWERDGWIRRSAENIVLLGLFLAGCPPGLLARRYNRGTIRNAP